MARTCWEAFVASEQEGLLVELLKYKEAPDNAAFARDFGLPDLDAGIADWADPNPPAGEEA